MNDFIDLPHLPECLLGLPLETIHEIHSHTYHAIKADRQQLGEDRKQAVLQSPEVQALRKDAERYRWLRDNSSVILDRHAWFKAESGTHIDTTMPSQRELDAAIDAAKEQ